MGQIKGRIKGKESGKEEVGEWFNINGADVGVILS
jgi:hypothetical protein